MTWQRMTIRTRRKTNLGWWLHGLGGPMVATALVLGCAALWLRQVRPEWVAAHAPAALTLAMVLCGLFAWARQRRHFIGARQAMIAIEARLGLHNALTTAAAGRGSWPAPLPYPPPLTRWHWPNTLVPPLAAAAFVAAGLLLPVPAPALPTKPEEPRAWKSMEEDMRALEEKKAVDPKSMEETRKVIEQLRAAGPDQWFKHSSMEATDGLKQMHERAMKGLERNLRKAGEAAAALAAGPEALTATSRELRKEQFQNAIEGMRAAGLKPNAALWEQLRKLNPDQLGQLSELQKQELLYGMDAVAEALREARGKDNNPAGDGDKNGDKDGDGGDGQAGQGGVDRGPGSSNDLFGEKPADLEANKPKPLKPGDLSRSKPGDLLELHDGAHDVKEVAPGKQLGGAARTDGGGAGAWQDSLHPREQEALKRFFE